MSGDNKKPIRLKGFLFEENFNYATYQQRMQTVSDDTKLTKKIETQVSKQQRLEEARKDFIAIYEHKRQQNAKKYAIPESELNWVAQHFKPDDIPNQVSSRAPKRLAEENDPSMTPSINDMMAANAKHKAKQKAKQKEQEEAEQRRLAAERLAKQIQKARQLIQEADTLRLVPILTEIGWATKYCGDYSVNGYERGYRPLKHLIQREFIKTQDQTESRYSDTMRLDLGRFEDMFHVTRDGRVGINYSAYSNVRRLEFFYSSDLFELKEDKFYIKHTDVFYNLSQMNQANKNLLVESLANSLENKLAIWSKPKGLEDALISYKIDLKQIPDFSLENLRLLEAQNTPSLDKDEIAPASPTHQPRKPKPDDYPSPGF